jgi:hypothetical protein
VLKDYFLNKIKEKYPDNFSKYDYSLLPNEFIYKSKIPVICNLHGVFQQVSDNHLQGKGCLMCSHDVNKLNNKLNTEKFIQRAREIHGDKYDYSKVLYINSHTKVIIICPTHGKFKQTPGEHLKGKGCKKCYCDFRTQTFNQFIAKVNKVHGNKYSYKDQSICYRCTITITCTIHGEFNQLVGNHLKGYGCFRCKESFGERYISQTLDKLQIQYQREYKISEQPYRYDFYLPYYDIYIEYHGKQHYELVDYFGGKRALNKCIKRDKTKIELIKRSTGLLITLKYTFNTLEKIKDELLRLFSIIHPEFLTNKELVKQSIIDSNIYLIQDGISYIRK